MPYGLFRMQHRSFELSDSQTRVLFFPVTELKDAFEVVSVGKESYVFRASTGRECRRWLKHLRLESKELGAWKRRRNGLPNIMIKNL